MKEKVNKVLEEKVRPLLARDGGDVELIEVTGENVVRVRLTGGCAGCPMAQMTLKMSIERILKEAIPEVKKVESVQ